MQKIIVLSFFIFDWTPLHWAAQNGHLSVVAYLVNQKADLKAENKDGETPIGLANIRMLLNSSRVKEGNKSKGD